MIRDELTMADVDAVSRADLVVLQPLRPDEAALAGTALGLGDSAEWLTRIRDDMVACGQPAGAALGATLGHPDRGAAGRPAHPLLTPPAPLRPLVTERTAIFANVVLPSTCPDVAPSSA